MICVCACVSDQVRQQWERTARELRVPNAELKAAIARIMYAQAILVNSVAIIVVIFPLIIVMLISFSRLILPQLTPILNILRMVELCHSASRWAAPLLNRHWALLTTVPLLGRRWALHSNQHTLVVRCLLVCLLALACLLVCLQLAAFILLQLAVLLHHKGSPLLQTFLGLL